MLLLSALFVCFENAMVKLIPPMLYILLSRNTFTIIYLTNKAGNAIPYAYVPQLCYSMPTRGFTANAFSMHILHTKQRDSKVCSEKRVDPYCQKGLVQIPIVLYCNNINFFSTFEQGEPALPESSLLQQRTRKYLVISQQIKFG